MSTRITHEYNYKVFSGSEIKLYATKLTRLYEILTSDYYIFLRYREDGYESSIQSTIDELDYNIGKIGTSLESLGFHYKSDIIMLNLNDSFNRLHILYMLNGDIAYSKKMILFTEEFFEVTRLEHEVSELTDVLCQDASDSLSVNNESTNICVNIWGMATEKLKKEEIEKGRDSSLFLING